MTIRIVLQKHLASLFVLVVVIYSQKLVGISIYVRKITYQTVLALITLTRS